jgi:hypothetical protein
MLQDQLALLPANPRDLALRVLRSALSDDRLRTRSHLSAAWLLFIAGSWLLLVDVLDGLLE